MTGTMFSRTQGMKNMLAIILAMSSSVATGKVIYVDGNASGANDGSSWTNAYAYLQDALVDAATAEKPVEVLIAQGIYKPDDGENQISGDREASFQLENGVTLTGGFAGLTEPDPSIRDIESYPTILSGDLNQDDVDVTEAYQLKNESSHSENSHHVVTSHSTDDTAVLDGFIIVAGNANGSESDEHAGDKYRLMRGGGMYIVLSSPIVANCIFTGNSACYGGAIGNWKGNPSLNNCSFVLNDASRYGGGIDNAEGEPSITNCFFSENSSSWGGGISNRAGGNTNLVGCTFSKNTASWCGGGMINVNSNPTLMGCVLQGNQARLGGGIRNSNSNPILTNCLIADNVAYCQNGLYGLGVPDGLGGGIFNSNSTPTLTNCTLSGNCAGDSTGGIYSLDGMITLRNCIVWGNSPSQISGDAIVSYSNIQGSWPGECNLDVDPLFARPGHLKYGVTVNSISDDLWVDGDYHLRSQAGRWDSYNNAWKIDTVTSPCIDAGAPTSPIGLEPFPNGGMINMGAYGGTVEASMSAIAEHR